MQAAAQGKALYYTEVKQKNLTTNFTSLGFFFFALQCQQMCFNDNVSSIIEHKFTTEWQTDAPAACDGQVAPKQISFIVTPGL